MKTPKLLEAKRDSKYNISYITFADFEKLHGKRLGKVFSQWMNGQTGFVVKENRKSVIGIYYEDYEYFIKAYNRNKQPPVVLD